MGTWTEPKITPLSEEARFGKTNAVLISFNMQEGGERREGGSVVLCAGMKHKTRGPWKEET